MKISKKLKVVTIVGTRPEIIRLSAIINRLNNSDYIDHYLIHTGQNYDMNLNTVFFKDLNIKKPDYYLDAAEDSPSSTIGKILVSIDPILDEIKPQAVLVLGDTNSALSVIAAKKKKIPIFHYEAGNRCFDSRVPEETNRKIIDHISDINLTYSEIAREHLINEGVNSDRVIKVGSPMYEVIQNSLKSINSSKILEKLKLRKNKYFVVSCHREENIDNIKNFNKLFDSLNTIAEKYSLPVIFSTHPRTQKLIEKRKPEMDPLILNTQPLGFNDYIKLQTNSLAVLSDSGTISEESSILNFRALNIREAHERPEAMEEASVILSGLNTDRIIQALESIRSQHVNDKRNILIPSDYCVPNVSTKVERILLSYVDYVNRVVWQKES